MQQEDDLRGLVKVMEFMWTVCLTQKNFCLPFDITDIKKRNQFI